MSYTRLLTIAISVPLLIPIGHAATTAGSSDASHVLDEWVSNTESEILEAADAMPVERYSFAPTAGAFRNVRSFGEQVKHLAAANYQLGARILRESPPHGEHNEEAPDSIRTK